MISDKNTRIMVTISKNHKEKLDRQAEKQNKQVGKVARVLLEKAIEEEETKNA